MVHERKIFVPLWKVAPNFHLFLDSLWASLHISKSPHPPKRNFVLRNNRMCIYIRKIFVKLSCWGVATVFYQECRVLRMQLQHFWYAPCAFSRSSTRGDYIDGEGNYSIHNLGRSNLNSNNCTGEIQVRSWCTEIMQFEQLQDLWFDHWIQDVDGSSGSTANDVLLTMLKP